MAQEKSFDAVAEAQKIIDRRMQQEFIKAQAELFRLFNLAFDEAVKAGYPKPEAIVMAQAFIQSFINRKS